MPKILLVEDNEFLRVLYSSNLTHKKYDVETAVDGAEALVKIRTCRPDLIILDIIRPEIDGIELLEFLKNDPQHKNIPVLILTGSSDLNTIQECLEKGARGYILKGGSLHEIAKQVNKIIGSAE